MDNAGVKLNHCFSLVCKCFLEYLCGVSEITISADSEVLEILPISRANGRH